MRCRSCSRSRAVATFPNIGSPWAGPAAFAREASADDVAPDLNGDDSPELVVANELDGTLTVLKGTSGLPRVAQRVPLPGGAADQPIAVAARRRRGRGAHSNDWRTEPVVASRGINSVYALPVRRGARVGAARMLARVPAPVGLITGAFGGDDQDDVAVASGSGSIRTLVSSGDRLIWADGYATSIAAGHGYVAWSASYGEHDYRLTVARTGHRPREMPAARSREPIEPHIGTSAAGVAVIAYARCGRDRCRPVLRRLADHHSRPLPAGLAAGCDVADVAVWRTAIAVIRIARRRVPCAPAQRGLWLQAPGYRLRRISATAWAIGDLKAGRASWFEDTDNTGGPWRLRPSRFFGAARTVDSGDDDCCAPGGGRLDGDWIYWSSQFEIDSGTLARVNLVSGRAERVSKEDDIPTDIAGYPEFAVDAGRVFYAGQYGIFAMAPDRLRPD
jgi:hypothetical protein